MNDDCSCSYSSALSGVKFFTVVIFILQIILVILAEDSIKYKTYKSYFLSEKTFDKYFENYNEIDIKCVEKFFKKLDKEEKYYDISRIVIRVLCSISIVSVAGLFLHSLTICCCELKFYSLFFVVPIYGLICNIITIGLFKLNVNAKLKNLMKK